MWCFVVVAMSQAAADALYEPPLADTVLWHSCCNSTICLAASLLLGHVGAGGIDPVHVPVCKFISQHSMLILQVEL